MNPLLEHELDTLWQQHVATWSNCGRCRLREWRLTIDPVKAKRATQVPFGFDFRAKPVLQAELDNRHAMHSADSLPFYPRPRRCRMVGLLPCPDKGQESISNLYGSGDKGYDISEQRLVVEEAAAHAAAVGVGIDPEDWGITVAVGCRPTDYTNTSNLLKPTATFINPCAPRWVTEVALMDPEMVVVLGHHAFVALNTHNSQVLASFGIRPEKGSKVSTKVSSYNTAVGEVSKLLIRVGDQLLYYPVYVAPDILVVTQHARADQWSAPFAKRPTRVPVKEGPAHMRWHMFVASVLVDEMTIRRRDGEGAHSAGWPVLLSALAEYYEDMTEVQNRADVMYDHASNIAYRESSQFGAHYSMLYGDVSDAPDPIAQQEEAEEMDESDPADDSYDTDDSSAEEGDEDDSET